VGDRDLRQDLAQAAATGPAVALVTRLVRAGRGFAFDRRVAVRADGQLTGTLGDPTLDARAVEAALAQLAQGPPKLLATDEQHDLLIEPVTSRPHLVIAGGGHVAKALARQAQLLDFDVTVLEDRPEFANRERFDGATVINAGVADSIGRLSYGPQTFLVVATRGHKMDAECVLAAARTNVRYIGLLGSRRKTVLIADMLRENGVPDTRLAAIRAPVGLDLGGRSPAEIALSVLAEITQIRYGGSGQPLGRRQP
jgi:xanthine dehydrogenase accessory factor